MNTQKRTKTYVAHTYNRYPVTFKKGKGCYLYDSQGKKYLDMGSGIAVSALGHGHKKVTKAVSKQVARLIHISNLYYSAPSSKLAQKLVEISGFKKAFFCNSGAEANEAGLKLARKWGKIKGGEEKHEIISFTHSFHGRTLATITVTGQPKYQEPFTPLLPGVKYAEYNDIDSVKKLASDKLCAIIVEPLQGEGGVREADLEFLKGLRTLCDENDALLLFDEVQTGVGRTGTFFNFEQYMPVKPDVVSLAKGIAAGMPMGVALFSEKVADILVPGDHASTFGGNLVSSQAALVVVEAMEKEGILNNVQQMGAYFKQELKLLQKTYPSIKDVRGRGFLLGVEIDFPASELVQLFIEKKIITVPAGASVVRFLPPLIAGQKEIDYVIQAFDMILKERNNVK